MEKEKAIPKGCMTVGEAAKKMGVTVRTLQYYDRIGLLSPEAESQGGRRLYTYKDLVKLHQVLSLKSLGFSLEDIRERLPSLETPVQVARVLEEQEADIEKKMESLSRALRDIRALKTEVLQMQTVDFQKYADIIVNLQMENKYYFLIKRFDTETLDHIRKSFDRESGTAFIEKFQDVCEKILELQREEIPPDSQRAQALTKEYWEMVMEFTKGDISLLGKLKEFGDFTNPGNQWEKKQALVTAYMEPALEIYFSRLGVNPFQGGVTDENGH